MDIIFGYIIENESVANDMSSLVIRHFHSSFPENETAIFRSGFFGLIFSQRADDKRIIAEKNKQEIILIQGNVFSGFGSNQNPNTGSDIIGQHPSRLITPEKLRGEFLIVHFTIRKKNLRIFTDHFSTHPLYFLETPGIFAFSTDVKLLKSIPGFQPLIEDQWIAETMLNLKSSVSSTPYSGLKKLDPASVLHYHQRIKIDKYFDLLFIEEFGGLSEEEAVTGFTEQLKIAIDHRIPNEGTIASELSGGLDSSGITALVMKACMKKGLPFYALSHVLSDKNLGVEYPFRDEREFSGKVAEYLDLKNHILCSGDNMGILRTLKNGIRQNGMPSQQAFHLLSDVLYGEASEMGVNILFSGFGGDEGVTSKSGSYISELINSRNWRSYKKYVLNRTASSRIGLRASARFWINYLLPFLNQQLSFNRDWQRSLEEKYRLIAVDTQFEQLVRLDELFFRRKNNRGYSNLKEEHYLRLNSPGLSRRLEYCNLAARANGIHYRYPLLDIDLLSFYLGLPSHLRAGEFERTLFRKAMKGFIPEDIRLRKDKIGTTIPSLQIRLVNDHEQIEQLILRSKETNRYHYFDYNRMLEWQKRIEQRKSTKEIVNPVAFINSLQILLLQEMERTGEFKSGIRC